jgi:hypothetical protein
MNTGNLFRKKTISKILLDSTDQALHGSGMKRTLGVVDLTALGVAAIVGAGIFSTIGNAAASGGPAVSLLFVFTAVACGLSAMCYAEFASSIPISGSAYTYAYASFGELVAWIMQSLFRGLDILPDCSQDLVCTSPPSSQPTILQLSEGIMKRFCFCKKVQSKQI